MNGIRLAVIFLVGVLQARGKKCIESDYSFLSTCCEESLILKQVSDKPHQYLFQERKWEMDKKESLKGWLNTYEYPEDGDGGEKTEGCSEGQEKCIGDEIAIGEELSDILISNHKLKLEAIGGEADELDNQAFLTTENTKKVQPPEKGITVMSENSSGCFFCQGEET
eukprot:GHVN01103484.1.p1 GENE.GHVN01103484.1~~GHVN01103484.1.p1  ORF type:complete len:167 (+),score=29.94 GHVN01103484.1:104-604(+)